jgi:hypothetical protein
MAQPDIDTDGLTGGREWLHGRVVAQQGVDCSPP